MSLIDEYVLSSNRKTRSSNVLYVTDLTKSCLASSYYGIIDPKSFPVETLRIFEAGRMIEDYWIQVLEAHPHYRVIGTQVPVYYYLGDWEIHGRADVLTQHKNGSLHVHEVKSIKNLYHVRRSGRPKPEHVDQLQFYLVGLGVDQGRVDYLDKSAFMQGKDVIDQSFMMTAERSVFTRLVNSARILISALESQSAPSPFPCWLCDYCQHSSICQRDQ